MSKNDHGKVSLFDPPPMSLTKTHAKNNHHGKIPMNILTLKKLKLKNMTHAKNSHGKIPMYISTSQATIDNVIYNALA